MKLSSLVSGILLAVLQLHQSSLVTEVDAYTSPIVIKNYKMYDANTAKYFGVRGVDYYPRPNAGELNVNNYDFFTDEYSALWTADLKQMAAVGANAVRLYAVDPSKSHDKFMCLLRSLGMYALIDFGASCEGCAVTADAYPTCYPPTLKARGKMIIDAFAKYDNLLAFSAGNEVNHAATTHNKPISGNAPCQKKFIRDMRAYIASCSTLRKIPVGVVLADSANERELNAKYYNCRTDANDPYENAEWYGLNVYQHCDGSVENMEKAMGFQNLLTDFRSYKVNIPVMFTEFGCLDKSFPTVNGYDAQRTFRQAGWMHTKAFREQFNGGFVFEYSTELANSYSTSPYPFTTYGAQNYGLGYYSPKDCDHMTKTCTFNRMPNFDFLATQYNATNYSDEPSKPEFVPDANKISFPACPAAFKKLSEIDWSEVESVSITACPSTAQDYTCPNQVSSGKWTSVSTGTGTTSGGTSGTGGKTTTTSPTGGTGATTGGKTPAATVPANSNSAKNGASKTTGPVLTTCALAAAAAIAMCL